MSRILLQEKYIIVVQYGHGFITFRASTNNRESAFRLVDGLKRVWHKKFRGGQVPTIYIFESVAHIKVEKMDKKPKKKKEKPVDSASELTLGEVR